MALSEQHGSHHSAPVPRPPAGTGAFVAGRMPNGWRLLANCQIGARTLQFVLIRPAAGVALLEIDPVWTPNAQEIFREHLAQADFTSRFPGNLPLIHRRMRPGDVAMLDMLHAEAFIWLEPLSIGADAGWEDALQALLTPAPEAETKPLEATVPPERLGVDTTSPKTREARLRRNAWIGLMAAGAALAAIVLVLPKATHAPAVSVLQPQLPALPVQAALPLTVMPAPPVAITAWPLPEPPPEIVETANYTIAAEPPMRLNAEPDAPDLLAAAARPAPAPFQPAAPLPGPITPEDIGAPALPPPPEPSPMEGIAAWGRALQATRIEPPLPENIPLPEPPAQQTPALALAPPMPMPAAP